MNPARVGWLFAINGAFGLFAGIALLAVPELFLSVLGPSTDPTGITLARIYGVEFAGFNVATWLARSTAPPSRAIVVGHVVNESLTAGDPRRRSVVGAG